MYKKIVSYLVFSLFAPLAAFSADDPSRARLYIPVATNTIVTGCTTCGVKVSGYAADYVFGFGLGLGVSSSKLSISSDYEYLNHSIETGPMINVGYTFGSEFTFTLGYGVGSSASSDQKDSDYSDYKVEGKSSSNSFLGLGYNIGTIEILLGMRSVTASLDQSYTHEWMGPVSYVADYTWSSTEIGIGFTF